MFEEYLEQENYWEDDLYQYNQNEADDYRNELRESVDESEDLGDEELSEIRELLRLERDAQEYGNANF